MDGGATSMQGAFDGQAMVREVIPDLDDHLPAYTVTSEEVDHELAVLFLEQLDQNLRDLYAALEPPKPEALKRVAHSLKGVGGTLGAPEVSVLAAELELAAKAGNPARCRALIDVLAQWAAAFRSAHNI